MIEVAFIDINCLQLDPARTITFSLTHCSEQENATEDDSAAVKDPKIVPRPVVSVETSIKYMNSDGKKLSMSFKCDMIVWRATIWQSWDLFYYKLTWHDYHVKLLQNPAYKQTYGNDPVWKMYRRNHKGQIPPRKTRRTCIVRICGPFYNTIIYIYHYIIISLYTIIINMRILKIMSSL